MPARPIRRGHVCRHAPNLLTPRTQARGHRDERRSAGACAPLHPGAVKGFTGTPSPSLRPGGCRSPGRPRSREVRPEVRRDRRLGHVRHRRQAGPTRRQASRIGAMHVHHGRSPAPSGLTHATTGGRAPDFTCSANAGVSCRVGSGSAWAKDGPHSANAAAAVKNRRFISRTSRYATFCARR